jgi:hypothetical protein
MCSRNAYQDCLNTATTESRINSYLQKNVTYIIGQLDNSTPTGSSDSNNELDTSCGGNFQGPDRLSRGTFYYESLSRFGTHRHRLMFAARVGHNAGQMYGSYPVRKALFGGDQPIKEYIAPYYTIKQKFNNRLLDAMNTSPYTAITNTAEIDWTQNWILTKVGTNEYRIQQQETLLYLDASTSSTYAVSLKNYSNTSTQIWILNPVTNEPGIYTLQQKSSLRYLDADTSSTSKYLATTQLEQADNTQKWAIQLK